MGTEWSEELAVGIDTIDAQHKEMFQRINALRGAMRRGVAREEAEGILSFLERYIEEHFSMEEAYMRRSGFPGIISHRSEHEAFTRDFAEFKKKWKSMDARGEITAFLEIEMERKFASWLAEHIGKTDKLMAAFLLENPS